MKKNTTITVSTETMNLLRDLKSALLLLTKENITYDALISRYIEAGVETLTPRLNALRRLLSEEQLETMPSSAEENGNNDKMEDLPDE